MLSAEQRERIERNKQLALERRQSRLAAEAAGTPVLATPVSGATSTPKSLVSHTPGLETLERGDDALQIDSNLKRKRADDLDGDDEAMEPPTQAELRNLRENLLRSVSSQQQTPASSSNTASQCSAANRQKSVSDDIDEMDEDAVLVALNEAENQQMDVDAPLNRERKTLREGIIPSLEASDAPFSMPLNKLGPLAASKLPAVYNATKEAANAGENSQEKVSANNDELISDSDSQQCASNVPVVSSNITNHTSISNCLSSAPLDDTGEDAEGTDGVASDIEGDAVDTEGVASDLQGLASDIEGEAGDVEAVASDIESDTRDTEAVASDIESDTRDTEGVASDIESDAKDTEEACSRTDGNGPPLLTPAPEVLSKFPSACEDDDEASR